MKKITNILRLGMVISMIAVPTILMAQQPVDPGSQPPDPGPNPLDTPFDGGVSLLVAAGVAYGLKKVHKRKKAEKL